MNILVVLNIHSYLCQNVRESFQTAADWWGCDYAEINTQTQRGQHPGYEKFTLARRFMGYERVLYLDSDMVIREYVPNPFRTFDERYFVAVPDLQTHFNHPGRHATVKQYRILQPEVEFCLGRAYNAPVPDHLMFNGGFLLFSPWHHRPAFDVLESAVPMDRPTWGLEQSLLNAAIHSLCKVHLAPITWNFLKHELSNPMTCYIQHFFGGFHQSVDNLRPNVENARYQKWRLAKRLDEGTPDAYEAHLEVQTA